MERYKLWPVEVCFETSLDTLGRISLLIFVALVFIGGFVLQEEQNVQNKTSITAKNNRFIPIDLTFSFHMPVGNFKPQISGIQDSYVFDCRCIFCINNVLFYYFAKNYSINKFY